MGCYKSYFKKINTKLRFSTILSNSFVFNWRLKLNFEIIRFLYCFFKSNIFYRTRISVEFKSHGWHSYHALLYLSMFLRLL